MSIYLPIRIHNEYKLRDWCDSPKARDVIDRAIKAGNGKDVFNLVKEYVGEYAYIVDKLLDPSIVNDYLSSEIEKDFPEIFGEEDEDE